VNIQRTFREYSGNIEETIGEHWNYFTSEEHSGNIVGTLWEHSGNIEVILRANNGGKIQGQLLREESGSTEGNIREESGPNFEVTFPGTFREHSGNLQGTMSEPSGGIEGTFRQPSRNLQGRLREPSGPNIEGTSRAKH
jgi:hypothetical protein